MLDKKLLILLAIYLLANVYAYSDEVELNMYVDKNVVEVNQQFVVTIELSGSEAQRLSLPNMPDLSSFANYLGSDTSQSIQIINGRMSASKSSNNYYIARVEGDYQIPSVSITYKDKVYKSNSISIKVVKGTVQGAAPSGIRPKEGEMSVEEASVESVFLQAEVDKKEVYVNQPIIVFYKLYTRVNVTGYNIIKLPSLVGFWSEEFDMPKQVKTYEKIINGEKYVVGELKKLAVFPTEAGDKEIDPMEIEVELRVVERKKYRSPFDSFFDDDFFFGKTIRKKILSKPIIIKVKPLPINRRPKEFEGAVGNLKMNAYIDKEQVNVNDAVSLKVRIEGSGNIKILQEPKIDFPADFDKYEPKVNLSIDRSGNEIKGYKEFEYVLIPRLVGKYTIKPFKYSYFNPFTGEYKILNSSEFIINVKAGRDYEQYGMKGLSKEEIKIIGRDIRFIKLSSSEFKLIGDYLFKRLYFKIILILPFVALLIAIYYKHKLNLLADNIAYARSRKASQEAKKRLSYAKKIIKLEKQKEFYAEVSRALLGYIADKLNLSAAGLISDEVADKLKQYSVDLETISAFMNILSRCDYQRFASSNSTIEEMKSTYEEAKNIIIKLENIKF